MLLALIFTGFLICLIFGEWPIPPRYITMAEAQALQKMIRENESKEYEERIRILKSISLDAKSEFLREDEAHNLRTLANDEFEKARTGWLKSLTLRHERGELTDNEFSDEINRCLDETAARTLL
ncbi:hypothetical protein [Runella slithyformis]|uniref:Uncharacterized protein n=1 Tax=Runella slithyformis (strain ATCC 29530 / DSM 19594 / LMG 11500 / NCIMB 11436 / LSU 4) TaxID=761193 RepID=A0A7U3ZQE0_RUNSL|nr:hypothetical protein [Runella slithyformis]AEI51460.1 hypothetical protein Runsl_5160 [Runella slithyformis DSM 19594]